jgi:hypothetical protein
MHHPNAMLERFLCDMCAKSAHHYFKVEKADGRFSV